MRYSFTVYTEKVCEEMKKGRLAQLVEQLVYTEKVGGSSPPPPTA